MSIENITLIRATAPASGDWVALGGPLVSIQATLTEGASAAAVVFEVSNDQKGAIPLTTSFTLSGVGASDGDSLEPVRFKFARARVTSLTGGAVICSIGVDQEA